MKKPSDYQCPDCDAPPFTRPHGLSRHRSQAHGVVSPTAAKKLKARPKARGRPRQARSVPSSTSPNGAGRYADAIAALEAQAGQLESQAKEARELAGRLKALA
jgi:hypothetical protein